MGAFLRRRLLTSVVALVGASLIAFLLPRLTPGDPALILAGDDATPEIIKQIREHWGLNKPLYISYALFVRNALTGDLGNSLMSGRPTVSLLADFLPNTARLALAAWVFSIVIGVPLGIVAALQRNKIPDYVAMFFALIGRGMPHFWLGIMLILLFAVQLKLLPTSGAGEGEITRVKHLILPTIVLSGGFLAFLVRMVRSEMLEVLSQDFIRTARSKGLAPRSVIGRHALKNALIPVVTILGLEVGALMSGAIITETVFAYPGIGRLAVQSISGLDYPVIQTLILFFAAVYIAANFLVDMMYGYLDPRIRYG